MIAYLQGKILFRSPTQSVIDCHGVGYEFFHTPATAQALDKEQAAVYIHTHLREDALILFGFSQASERSLFRELIRVSGVGPKLALSILSGLDVKDLTAAIHAQDVSRLQKIPGIGKKTAERLVIELRDRLKDVGLSSSSQISQSAQELESVLSNLGYPRQEIVKALRRIQDQDPTWENRPLEDLVKTSLGELTRTKSGALGAERVQ